MSCDKYNFLFTFILNILVKTIIILIIMLSYLYLYYGPKIKKGINTLIDGYNDNMRFISSDSTLGNYSNSKDILLSYSIVLILMIFSTIIFYNYVNGLGFNYISDDSFYLDLVFSGIISVYIIHYTLDNYSINIYDILIEKMNKTKLIF